MEYKDVIALSWGAFENKFEDYGCSWTMLRSESLTDQLFIKAWRVRNILQSGNNLVGDSIADDLIGIINYSLIAIHRLEKDDIFSQYEKTDLSNFYYTIFPEAYVLYTRKNTDYGAIFQKLRRSSIIDFILVKLMRIKSIEEWDEDNENKVGAISSELFDILNYGVLLYMREFEEVI